jgi:hypothetical protein
MSMLTFFLCVDMSLNHFRIQQFTWRNVVVAAVVVVTCIVIVDITRSLICYKAATRRHQRLLSVPPALNPNR